MNTDVGTNMNSILSWLEEAGMNLLSGILVLVIGFFLVHWIGKLLKRNKKLLTVEPTLRGFLQNLVKIFLSVIVILTAVNMMGIPMTSVVTLLASGGVALGLALQGAVGNLLGGLILLILRPIRAGEYVKIGEHVTTAAGSSRKRFMLKFCSIAAIVAATSSELTVSAV